MVLNPIINEKFRNAFEHRCLQLMFDGYKAIIFENTLQLTWSENDISAELHRHIKENPLRLKWKVSSNVEENVPKNIPRTRGFADKYPRIDFRLTSFTKNGEYEYFFEAKNLRQNDTVLKRRYITTGIDHFVTKRYPNGSLIGYLLEGGIDATVKGINRLLARDNRQSVSALPSTYFLSN